MWGRVGGHDGLSPSRSDPRARRNRPAVRPTDRTGGGGENSTIVNATGHPEPAARYCRRRRRASRPTPPTASRPAAAGSGTTVMLPLPVMKLGRLADVYVP